MKCVIIMDNPTRKEGGSLNVLLSKFKEVAKSVVPILAIVLFLRITLVDIQMEIIWRFFLGGFIVILGLGIFLWGAELGITEIGSHMGERVARSRSYKEVLFLGILMGFFISVAEPDLLILGNQVSSATGGIIPSMTIVLVVSLGVGVLIAAGLFRILLEKPLNKTMTLVYGIILILGVFVSEEFLAISFDASGATTGAMTTPFILALGYGVSKLKGGDTAEENSFGLVGMASAGPILAVMLMSILAGMKNIQGDPEVYQMGEGIVKPFLQIIPHTFVESLLAIAPITILFFAFNRTSFKLSRKQLRRIVVGLIYTFIGLVIFLAGVNGGFMDVGRIIGKSMVSLEAKWMTPVLGFVLGMVVVLAEPAVYVLGEQVEEVTGGHIPKKILLGTFSIGVAAAVSLSILRIMIPALKLWHFLLPGFAIAIVLSYQVKPIFAGIAFDAGGVASGPMTATFILAFAQGAAEATPTANVLVDGFGVIAMVAMTPVLAMTILGMIFKKKEEKEEKRGE